MKQISLFDLDKTLIKGNCSYLFGRYLHRKGHLSTLSALYPLSSYLLHTTGFLSLEGLHRQVFKTLFLNKPAAFYQTLAAEFFEGAFKTIVCQPVYERLLTAKEQGHFVAILSSSPDFMVQLFAQKFGVDAFYATDYLINEGHFQALGTILDGPLKKKHAESLSHRLGVPLEHHSFYTDSILDLPLLQAVGKPIAVNPDKQLREISLTQRWEIITD